MVVVQQLKLQQVLGANMVAVGWVLVLGGIFLSLVGTVILVLGAIQLYRQMFKPPEAKTAPAGGAAAGPAINLADLTKLIEAVIKMPQWLLAILAGDLQIYLGYWLATGSRWF